MLKKTCSALLAIAALTGTPLAFADQTVTLGYAGPLTGEAAHVGKDGENGVRLAIEEANAQNLMIGGQKIHFAMQSEDDAADPRQAVTVAQRLVDANVSGVVGHLNSGATLPASKVYSDAGIPQVSPASTAPAFTRQGLSTAFRVIGDDIYVGRVIAQYLAETLKVKRVALIDDRTSFGQGVADSVEAALRARNIEIVTREFTTNHAIDFRATLTRIKAKSPDAIFFGGIDAQAGPLRKQMTELAMKAVLVGESIETDKFIQLAGADAANGTISAESGQPLDAMPGGKTFRDAFSKRFGAVVLYAPYSYDATWALINAMKLANSTKPGAYLPAMKKINFEGLTGRIAFDQNGDLRSANVTLYAADKGQFKPVKTVSLK